MPDSFFIAYDSPSGVRRKFSFTDHKSFMAKYDAMRRNWPYYFKKNPVVRFEGCAVCKGDCCSHGAPVDAEEASRLPKSMLHEASCYVSARRQSFFRVRVEQGRCVALGDTGCTLGVDRPRICKIFLCGSILRDGLPRCH